MALLDSFLGLFRRGSKMSAPVATLEGKGYQLVSSSGGWVPIIGESFTGAWQRNIQINRNSVSAFHANFSCKTLIARDVGKLGGPLLMQRDSDGIWIETTNPAYTPVLRKPNRYQTRNQFWESWILSKLDRGNTYVLKVRDFRRVVVGLHVLDPDRVQVLESDDGSVFYQLNTDKLAGLPNQVTVPSTEIIHDRMNCLFHRLIGIPPIYAAALAALQGLNIQTQSARLYANNAAPGGTLTAPNHIPDDTAARLKADWEQRFSGENLGRVAVLGDGLKFEKMSFSAEEAQTIEQLSLAAEIVCSTYHVPPFKIGVGDMPSYDNVVALQQVYYESCLQSLLEDAEICLDEGLGLEERPDLGVEFDTERLMRMDPSRLADAVTKLVGGSIFTPNEARKKFNKGKLKGGDTVYMQQQNYSLEALAKRDAREDPWATSKPPPAEPPANGNQPPMPSGNEPPDDDAMMDDETKAAIAAWALTHEFSSLPALRG